MVKTAKVHGKGKRWLDNYLAETEPRPDYKIVKKREEYKNKTIPKE